MNILSYFPFQTFRPYQEKILKDLEDNISSYNMFMLEAPTGFGKSAVAYTLAKYLQQELGLLSHFVVADKYLQEQYLNSTLEPIPSKFPELEGVEFELEIDPQEQYIRAYPELVMVKGRGNFICPYNPIGDVTCDKAMCTIIEGYDCPHKPRPERIETLMGSMPVFDEYGVLYDWSYVDDIGAIHCLYWAQKDNGIRSDMTIHNYYYFLYEQNFAKSFAKRELGIFDEAHIIEKILMGFEIGRAHV